MGIRTELIKAGFTSEYVDEVAKEAHERRVKLLPSKKRISDIKIVQFSTMDWAEYLIDKVSHYYYSKQLKNTPIPEFTGNKNNPIEVWEYNAKYGIMPEETIHNEDGTITHRYKDGTVVNIKVNLTGVFNEKQFEQFKKRERRLLADYLKMSEEKLLNMDDSEVEDIIKKNEKNRKLSLIFK